MHAYVYAWAECVWGGGGWEACMHTCVQGHVTCMFVCRGHCWGGCPHLRQRPPLNPAPAQGKAVSQAPTHLVRLPLRAPY